MRNTFCLHNPPSEVDIGERQEYVGAHTQYSFWKCWDPVFASYPQEALVRETFRRGINLECVTFLTIVCCVTLAKIAIAVPQDSTGSSYHVVRKLPLGGEGR